MFVTVRYLWVVDISGICYTLLNLALFISVFPEILSRLISMSQYPLLLLQHQSEARCIESVVGVLFLQQRVTQALHTVGLLFKKNQQSTKKSNLPPFHASLQVQASFEFLFTYCNKVKHGGILPSSQCTIPGFPLLHL